VELPEELCSVFHEVSSVLATKEGGAEPQHTHTGWE